MNNNKNRITELASDLHVEECESSAKILLKENDLIAKPLIFVLNCTVIVCCLK